MTGRPPSRAGGHDGAPGFYSPQLDGLRFIAALLVFYHHSWTLPGLETVREYGWIGVDLFLAISAFLLTRLLVTEFERWNSISLSGFFIRRALRIWPLYLVFSSFVSALALVRQDLPVETVVETWLSFITFTHNILVALQGYTQIEHAAHLWTISLEEQAYLVLPLFLLLTLRRGWTLANFLGCIAAGIALLLVLRAAVVAADVPHPFIWVTPLRADSFLLGMLAAMIARPEGDRTALLAFGFGAAVIGSTALFPSVENSGPYQIFGYTTLAAGCALLVWASQGEIIERSWLAAAPLRFLGKISYGIYVYHLLVIDLSHAALLWLGVDTGPVHFVVSLALTIAVSALSYRVLERPFLIFKQRFSKVVSRPV